MSRIVVKANLVSEKARKISFHPLARCADSKAVYKAFDVAIGVIWIHWLPIFDYAVSRLRRMDPRGLGKYN
jgi:hypothetical protein